MKEMKTTISILLKESSFLKLEEMRGETPRGKFIEMLIDEKNAILLGPLSGGTQKKG